jgi:hypothetical protein
MCDNTSKSNLVFSPSVLKITFCSSVSPTGISVWGICGTNNKSSLYSALNGSNSSSKIFISFHAFLDASIISHLFSEGVDLI